MYKQLYLSTVNEYDIWNTSTSRFIRLWLISIKKKYTCHLTENGITVRIFDRD